MEQNSKYYTPSIEEFHVGFEYEMKSTFGDGTTKTPEDYDKAEWVKTLYNLRSFPYVDRMMRGKNSEILPPALRVKYLDKEDIESLGWQYRIDSYWIEKGDEIWSLYSTGNDPDIYWQISCSSRHGYTKYTMRFKIKNKSELKKLMQQLGITKGEISLPLD